MTRPASYCYSSDNRPYGWNVTLAIPCVTWCNLYHMTGRELTREHQTWRQYGNCANKTVAEVREQDGTFFMGRGGKANKAKIICDDCPVKRQCLAFALFYEEEEGIWGGTTPDDRRDMPDFIKDLMRIEAPTLIDTTETRDPYQWLPIIYPNGTPVNDGFLPDLGSNIV